MTRAVYFDGQVAADRQVEASLTPTGISFHGDDVPATHWPYSQVSPVDPYVTGRPLRLACETSPGARLVIHDDAFNTELIAKARHLRGGINMHRFGRLLAWIAGGLIVVAAATYVTVQFAPKPIAFLLPDTWRDRVGTQIEASLTEGARVCDGAEGQRAMGTMFARVAEGDPDLPAVQIRVYDIPIMNAFAMPGERIVVTAELIRRADRPEEVAGVLAHELGHVVNRHSETQLVRIMGMQILAAIVTGGGGGDTISQFAGLAAILSYSRAAEEEADRYAVSTTIAAAIDPTGLRTFFEKILREEREGDPDKKVGNVGQIFSTHPGTEDRINSIPSLPPDVTARPVLSDEQWQALKSICDKG